MASGPATALALDPSRARGSHPIAEIANDIGPIGARRSPVARESRRAERRLISAAQDGSEEALEALFRRHWPLAHRTAFLVVRDAAAAEDIAQEAFLAAIRALERFDRRRPFGPWLHRIVVNRAIDFSRSRSLRGEVGADREGGRELASPPGHPLTAGSPISDELGRALRALDPERRAIVVLRYLLELTPGEIAETLGIPRGTVNSRLRRALDQLEATLGPEGRQ